MSLVGHTVRGQCIQEKKYINSSMHWKMFYRQQTQTRKPKSRVLGGELYTPPGRMVSGV